ncbi:MAG: hypothetical protein N3A61_07860, partial [Ignavibacteria bacterium]|nr:hypothetical protein [Ignavibacteria bacterium]
MFRSGLMFVLYLTISCVLYSCSCSSSSCSKDQSTEQKEAIHKKTDNQQIPKPPTTIQENQSLVEASIVAVYKNTPTDFNIKLKINNVTEMPNYINIAKAGDEIIASPSFYLDETMKMTGDERNT